MKKYFEIPEVSAAEIGETDVIMASETVGANTDKYSVYKSNVTSDFEIWKGLGD